MKSVVMRGARGGEGGEKLKSVVTGGDEGVQRRGHSRGGRGGREEGRKRR